MESDLPWRLELKVSPHIQTPCLSHWKLNSQASLLREVNTYIHQGPKSDSPSHVIDKLLTSLQCSWWCHELKLILCSVRSAYRSSAWASSHIKMRTQSWCLFRRLIIGGNCIVYKNVQRIARLLLWKRVSELIEKTKLFSGVKAYLDFTGDYGIKLIFQCNQKHWNGAFKTRMFPEEFPATLPKYRMNRSNHCCSDS